MRNIEQKENHLLRWRGVMRAYRAVMALDWREGIEDGGGPRVIGVVSGRRP